MSLDGLPGLAEVAIQSGRHAARTIRRRLEGDAGQRPFRYRDLGSLAAVSRFYAMGSVGVSASPASRAGSSGSSSTSCS